MPLPLPDRVLDLDGPANARDLGGLRTPDGRRVKRQLLYRSAYPIFADDDAELVRSLGIVCVVDLRTDMEVEFECVKWASYDVIHHRAPLAAEAGSRTLRWRTPYPAYLSGDTDGLIRALRLLMDSSSQPALFHCAAGKDRTGVVAAILLSILDVDRQEIIEDYELSQLWMDQIVERLRFAKPYARMLADSAEVEPHRESLDDLFDYLDKHGGATAWLTARGIDSQSISRFRAEMLEPT